jgi:transcriptional regulator with XRE-family HTH domain
MPKRIGFQKQRPRRRTFIRQWRELRNLTQDQLGERLETSGSMISRIEKGETPYTQDTLEAIADALQTDAASLLMRDPTDPDAIWSIWDQAQSVERDVIRDMAQRIVGGKTGAGGR